MIELENLSLTEKEVADLINQYRSEIRKLEYQLEKAKDAVSELTDRSGIEISKASIQTTPTTKKRRGRPPKQKTRGSSNGTATAKAPKKRRGRPPKSETKAKAKTTKTKKSRSEGYRLSEWDNFIINELKKAKRVMINAEFLKKAMSKSKREKLGLTETDIKGKLNRSIHKLANKREEIVKVSYPGKGFAYGLKTWKDDSGQLESRYMVEFEN